MEFKFHQKTTLEQTPLKKRVDETPRKEPPETPFKSNNEDQLLKFKREFEEKEKNLLNQIDEKEKKLLEKNEKEEKTKEETKKKYWIKRIRK